MYSTFYFIQREERKKKCIVIEYENGVIEMLYKLKMLEYITPIWFCCHYWYFFCCGWNGILSQLYFYQSAWRQNYRFFRM